MSDHRTTPAILERMEPGELEAWRLERDRRGAADDADARKRCSDCGWALPRFGCPYEGCNGIAMHTQAAEEAR